VLLKPTSCPGWGLAALSKKASPSPGGFFLEAGYPGVRSRVAFYWDGEERPSLMF
jgi:hypothetical protein